MTDVSQASDGATNQTGDTTADKFKSQFASFKGQAADKARDYAGQGVNRATGALDEAAKFLEDTARTIEEKLGPQYGRYGFSAAESVSGFAEQLRGKEVDELVEDVRTLVRKSPAVAIGAAVGLGFVLARLAKAGAGFESGQHGGTGTQSLAATGASGGGDFGASPIAQPQTQPPATGTGTGGFGGTTDAATTGTPVTPSFPA